MTDRSGWIDVPDGWERVRSQGPWPFVTAERFRRPDGGEVVWRSRASRRHPPDADLGSTWWAPRARGWWIGVLFAIGSTCFLFGAFPPYADAVGEDAANVTFFVGSLFFTTAAYLQYHEAIHAARRAGVPLRRPDRTRGGRWEVVSWEPRRIDWWATTVQLAGTVLFNVSTVMALRQGLDAVQQDRSVWRPDLYGSICFLVASTLAFAEVGHAWLSWRPRRLAWWIGVANLVGAVAFGVSAVGAYVIVDTGTLLNEAAANGGTFLGALGFLVGAVLLLPERVRDDESVELDTHPASS